MTEAATKSRKWLIGGLILSLALNIFLASFMLARTIRPIPAGTFPGHLLHQMISDLPPASRQQAWQIMRERRPLLRQQIEAMKQAQKQLRQVVESDQINPADLSKAFDNLRQTRDNIQQTLQGGFVPIIMLLSPQQRRDLTRRWYHPPYHHFHHWRHHAGPDVGLGQPPAPLAPPPSPSPAPGNAP